MRVVGQLNTAIILSAWACLPAVAIPSAVGFQAQVRPPLVMEATSPRAGGNSLLPTSDRDAETWLKRAAEAASRRDWKLAADTLERVIDQHGDRTVTLDEGRRYFSAIHLAQAQIADWPPEGLAAYRILYDPEARRALSAAGVWHGNCSKPGQGSEDSNAERQESHVPYSFDHAQGNPVRPGTVRIHSGALRALGIASGGRLGQRRYTPGAHCRLRSSRGRATSTRP